MNNRNRILRLLLLVILCIGSITLNAQSINKKFKAEPLKKVLKEVERETGLSIIYKTDEVNENKRISEDFKNATIEEVLSKILDNDLTYQLQNKMLIISKVNEKAQQGTGKPITVKGVVTDEKGEPIIGASILVKGTGKGTITDMNGTYTLDDVASGAVLQFTYVGYRPQEIIAGNKSASHIVMADDAQALQEVVVTALGIKRSEKALSYNVQQVNADAITSNKDANFINALNGKVAGVTINASSSGVGGISKVVMRGTKSIMQSSNALYVIDGVPMFTANSNDKTNEFASQGASESIADINPEDIESMSVLTGAAAAALYGSEAANGAIIITTKKGKEGRMSITVNSNVEFNNPFVLPQFQTRYGTGINGLFQSASSHSYGTKLTTENYRGYKPANDYFQTGMITTESVSMSAGTEKNQTYASAAAVNSKGIVPNNKYSRYNFTVRNTTSFLNDKMTLDMGASYISQNDRNMVNQGTYNNPLVGAYLFPRGNDWGEIGMYERYDPARKIYTQWWPVGDADMTMQNPYWINYRNLRENKKDRYMLNAGLNYEILDWLSVSGRVRFDHSSNDYTEKFYASTNTQLTELSNRGLYGITQTRNKQLYADFLVNINKTFGENWSLQANVGGSFSDMRQDVLTVRGPIADGSDPFKGEKVGLTNYFAVQNLSTTKTKHMQSGWWEQAQSLFGSAELGYKSTYYLTLTGRNDWPSQLAGPQSVKKSFFYPSVGLSVVLSELLPHLNKSYLSYMKLRGSFASVGTAFQRYIANPLFTWDASSGQWSVLTQYPVYDLKPERTRSFELGLNMRFLKHFALDVTYYNAKTMNQTLNPDLPISGYSALYVQTGAVRNQGLELSLNYNNTWRDFTWETGFTFSANRNKILTLADNVWDPVNQEYFSIKSLNMGGLGDTRFLLREGGSMGDLYSLMDLRRDANGAIYIDEENNIHTESIQNPDKYVKLGSVLPKGNLSWRNHFTWKNFDLGFMLSARLGGVVFSRTQALLDNFGVSEASAASRDLGYVAINGNDRVNPEKWYSAVADGNAVAQYYTYSATNIRLQEASIGYTFSRKMLKDICDIRISLVGRNLWMIYNKAPFDPETVANTDNFYQGIDYFMMPSLRNFGFNLSFKF